MAMRMSLEKYRLQVSKITKEGNMLILPVKRFAIFQLNSNHHQIKMLQQRPFRNRNAEQYREVRNDDMVTVETNPKTPIIRKLLLSSLQDGMCIS